MVDISGKEALTSPTGIAIRGVIDAFVVAFCKGDVDAIRPLFTDNAVVYPSNDRDRVGWSSIADYWAGPFESLQIELRVDVHDLTISANLAVAEMVTFAAVRPKSGGEQLQRKYRDMVVLRRIDNAWRIHRNLSQAYPADVNG